MSSARHAKHVGLLPGTIRAVSTIFRANSMGIVSDKMQRKSARWRLPSLRTNKKQKFPVLHIVTISLSGHVWTFLIDSLSTCFES